MKKGLGLLIGLILAGLVLSACGAQQITENMDGQTVTVKPGETFTITLTGNPTTGYGWQMADLNTAVLKILSEPSYKPDTLMTGSGGTYVYKFEAVGAGTATIKFNYLRAWEKNKLPYKTFTITVAVE
jgi:inhibitor of cysteine peptidase